MAKKTLVGEKLGMTQVWDDANNVVPVTVLRVTPQISPDGLFWCEEGSAPLLISKPGLYSFALREFGHWLRLDARLAGAGAQVKVLIYLALKE